jgi:hypothetical protein
VNNPFAWVIRDFKPAREIMMNAFSRLILATAVSTAVLVSAVTQSSAQTAVAPSQVQIDLFRGLADIFSRGMDTLGDKLNRQGYRAHVYSTGGWQNVARRIADQYARGQKGIVVLIGHSLGANATLDIANELSKSNVPIELIVTFDATEPHPVPKNVLHLVNFYQNNGFGKKITPGPGFQGELTNLDLTADANIRHITIDKSDRLHAYAVAKIAEIVNKDLADKVKASKSKGKKKKRS